MHCHIKVHTLALNGIYTTCLSAEALASQVTEENFANGLIYPPFANIRKISANIAACVGAKTYQLG